MVAVVATLLAFDSFAATYGATQSGSSAIFYVDTTSWADIHYTKNNGGQQNFRMAIVNGRNQYTVTGLVAGDFIDYSYTYWDVSCNCARDTTWARYTHGGTQPPVDAGTDAGTDAGQ
ncbi:thiol oxidoreductase, partial [Pyxidicoccus sp. 3LFB2]